MITDKLATFCEATTISTITAGATGKLCGDVYDTQGPSQDNTLTSLGQSPLFLLILVTTTFVGATSTTTFELASDSTANLATSRTTHIRTKDTAVATLVAGYTFILPVPPDITYERYIGVWATSTTADVTTAAISAYLTTNIRAWKAYNNRV